MDERGRGAQTETGMFLQISWRVLLKAWSKTFCSQPENISATIGMIPWKESLGGKDVSRGLGSSQKYPSDCAITHRLVYVSRMRKEGEVAKDTVGSAGFARLLVWEGSGSNGKGTYETGPRAWGAGASKTRTSRTLWKTLVATQAFLARIRAPGRPREEEAAAGPGGIMWMRSGERGHSWGLPLFQKPGDLPSDPEARTPLGGEREALLGGSRASSHNTPLQAKRKPVNKSVGSTRPPQRKFKACICGKEEMWFWVPKRGRGWNLQLHRWGQSWARVLVDYERNGLWVLRKGRGHQEGLTVTSGSGQLKTSVCEYVYSVVSDSIRPNELSLPSSSVMECSRQEYWNGLPFPN